MRSGGIEEGARDTKKSGGLLRQRKSMRYKFIEAEGAYYSIRILCRGMEGARGGYYAWIRRGESRHANRDQDLLERIRGCYDASHGRYGSRRIYDERRIEEERISKKRVERLRQENGLRGKQRRKFRVTTYRHPGQKVAAKPLKQCFEVEHPDTVWSSDISQLWTPEGWLYLAIVLNPFSRTVVGWGISVRSTRHLILDAVQMALQRRHPKAGLIFHSDQGGQYVARDIEKLLLDYGFIPSMSGKGNCYDNAASKSLFSRLKEELGDSFLSRGRAKTDVFEYIEIFFNRNRRRLHNGNLTPLEYEQFYARLGRRPKDISDFLAYREVGARMQAREGGPIQEPVPFFPCNVPVNSLQGELLFNSCLKYPPKWG